MIRIEGYDKDEMDRIDNELLEKSETDCVKREKWLDNLAEMSNGAE